MTDYDLSTAKGKIELNFANSRGVDDTGNMDDEAKSVVAHGLAILMDAVALNNFVHGWRVSGAPARPMGDLIALLHSEVTEAFEAYRNNEPALWFEYTDNCSLDVSATMPKIGHVLGKPQGIASELADVMIRMLDMAQELNIPLIDAIFYKHAYNQTRPYRHGGKAV